MASSNDLAQFSHYWLSGEYLLLCSDGSGEIDECLIFNHVKWSVQLIEDDAVYLAIKQAMQQHGVPVVLKLLEPNPIQAFCEDLDTEDLDLRERNRRRDAFLEARRRAFLAGDLPLPKHVPHS